MKAARLVAFGDPPTFELQDVSEPAPASDEVVVAVRTAALNRRDPWVWATPDYCELPVTLGSDAAGVVAAIGSDVRGVSVGDEVVVNPTLNWPEGAEVPAPDFDILGAPTEGTFAEQVAVPAGNVGARPARLTWEEAGALALSGLTAWRAAVTCGRVGSGTSVLVTGAGSGVSTFLVQIATALGARVLATTSSEAKEEHARSLGATDVFRYDDPAWPEHVRDAVPEGLDVVIDSYGGPSWSRGLPLLRRGGLFVSFGDTGGAEATIALMDVYWEWRSILGTSMGSPSEFRALLAHVEQAPWRPCIDSVYSLAEIDLAAARLADRDRFGKIVLRISDG